MTHHIPHEAPHSRPALPSPERFATRLDEIHDCLTLTLALDAMEGGSTNSPGEREAHGYIRAALRQTGKLMEVGQC